VRFTQKGDSLYAFFLERPEAPRVTLPGAVASEGTAVRVLGAAADTKWEQQGRDVLVNIGQAPGPYAMGLRITPAPRALD
jgi:alpha-L-fucosidase